MLEYDVAGDYFSMGRVNDRCENPRYQWRSH